MQIGLIGGIGPAATDYYYRKLIDKFNLNFKELSLTIVHADTPTLLTNLEQGNYDDQIDIYNKLTNRLADAGAGCVAITSIAGHFCINQFKPISKLPIIDLLTCTENKIRAQKYEKIGLIGTRTVMETKFYSGIQSAEIHIPNAKQLDAVHNCYVTMAKKGFITEEQQKTFDEACSDLLDQHNVDAILLGGTDLALAYSDENSNFPIIDCAEIHINSIFDFYINNSFS